jgi:hypothetical protein
MNATSDAVGAAQQTRTRALIVPREHGAWGLLLVPLFTGVVAGFASEHRIWPLLMFTVAAQPVQLVKRLKYLSRPARNGPTPSPIRSTHHPWSNRESNPLFMCAASKTMESAGANRLQIDTLQFSA